eukprot:GHVT01037396.1.p1 GENE.GHVT01037396.1~~GHVT01037396.1.p1  ORF type:complete len:891 (+),score=189.96 GHVT01037396.1:1365-4037(+)
MPPVEEVTAAAAAPSNVFVASSIDAMAPTAAGSAVPEEFEQHEIKDRETTTTAPSAQVTGYPLATLLQEVSTMVSAPMEIASPIRSAPGVPLGSSSDERARSVEEASTADVALSAHRNQGSLDIQQELSDDFRFVQSNDVTFVVPLTAEGFAETNGQILRKSEFFNLRNRRHESSVAASASAASAVPEIFDARGSDTMPLTNMDSLINMELMPGMPQASYPMPARQEQVAAAAQSQLPREIPIVYDSPEYRKAPLEDPVIHQVSAPDSANSNDAYSHVAEQRQQQQAESDVFYADDDYSQTRHDSPLSPEDSEYLRQIDGALYTEFQSNAEHGTVYDAEEQQPTAYHPSQQLPSYNPLAQQQLSAYHPAAHQPPVYQPSEQQEPAYQLPSQQFSTYRQAEQHEATYPQAEQLEATYQQAEQSTSVYQLPSQQLPAYQQAAQQAAAYQPAAQQPLHYPQVEQQAPAYSLAAEQSSAYHLPSQQPSNYQQAEHQARASYEMPPQQMQAYQQAEQQPTAYQPAAEQPSQYQPAAEQAPAYHQPGPVRPAHVAQPLTYHSSPAVDVDVPQVVERLEPCAEDPEANVVFLVSELDSVSPYALRSTTVPAVAAMLLNMQKVIPVGEPTRVTLISYSTNAENAPRNGVVARVHSWRAEGLDEIVHALSEVGDRTTTALPFPSSPLRLPLSRPEGYSSPKAPPFVVLIAENHATEQDLEAARDIWAVGGTVVTVPVGIPSQVAPPLFLSALASPNLAFTEGNVDMNLILPEIALTSLKAAQDWRKQYQCTEQLSPSALAHYATLESIAAMSPRWGGDDESADAAEPEVVMSSTNDFAGRHTTTGLSSSAGSSVLAEEMPRMTAEGDESDDGSNMPLMSGLRNVYRRVSPYVLLDSFII